MNICGQLVKIVVCGTKEECADSQMFESCGTIGTDCTCHDCECYFSEIILPYFVVK